MVSHGGFKTNWLSKWLAKCIDIIHNTAHGRRQTPKQVEASRVVTKTSKT